MPTASFASHAPTGVKKHNLTKEQVLSEIKELEAMYSACEKFDNFINGIECYGMTALNTSIRERKLYLLRARLRDFSFAVSETIEQVKRDNKKLIETP